MKKIRVCHITNLSGIGGIEVMLMDYLNSSKYTGILNYLIGINTSKTVLNLLKKNIPQKHVKRKTKLDLKFLFEIYNFIKKNNIDIVHTHGTEANALVGFTTLLTNAKLITHEHGSGWYINFPMGILEGFVMRHCHKIIANSNAASLVIQKNRRAPKENITVIYNGINFNRLTSIKPINKSNLKKNIIGSLGRLVKEKDIFTLIDSFNLLRDDMSLIIVGDGNQRKILQKYAKKTRKNKDIHFVGEKLNITDYYKIFDLFVVPSVREPYGNSVCEASYLGIPTIGANIDGLSENIVDNITGILVDPNIDDSAFIKNNNLPPYQIRNNKLQKTLRINPKDLAYNIKKILSNDKLKFKLGNNAKKVIKERNSIEIYIKKLHTLYYLMVNQK